MKLPEPADASLTLQATDPTLYPLGDLISEQERQALVTLRRELEKVEAGWRAGEQDAVRSEG